MYTPVSRTINLVIIFFKAQQLVFFLIGVLVLNSLLYKCKIKLKIEEIIQHNIWSLSHSQLQTYKSKQVVIKETSLKELCCENPLAFGIFTPIHHLCSTCSPGLGVLRTLSKCFTPPLLFTLQPNIPQPDTWIGGDLLK